MADEPKFPGVSSRERRDLVAYEDQMGSAAAQRQYDVLMKRKRDRAAERKANKGRS